MDEGLAKGRNLKELLGNPKIIFVLGMYIFYYILYTQCLYLIKIGGPASGKGT